MRGNSKAQTRLGGFYQKGIATKADEKEAFSWYMRAAEKDPEAQFMVGYCYLHGTGVFEEPNRAVEWLKRSADKKCAQAICELGHCYEQGIGGLHKSAKEAAKLYIQAAEMMDGTAMFRIGAMMEAGHSFKKDAEGAKKWYKQAARRGNREAKARLAAMEQQEQEEDPTTQAAGAAAVHKERQSGGTTP
eukprot:TRINITY_DN12450_c0_g1_i2.p1 TRINITY_DN12450_c0_g1~~TRINITY_DN12450_c0_g1_i2.p1  ORF type:complete len:215 (-),score=59.56 TRINITY_DN12450_c0_g1_i2:18-584(-)